MNIPDIHHIRKDRKALSFYAVFVLIAIFFAFFIVRWLFTEPEPQGSLNLSNGHLPVTNTVDRKIVKLPTLEKGEPDLLTIPDLKITVPVIYIEVSNKEADQEALAKGVVHYPDTANPGEWGNIYIFGHSSDYAWKPGKYKTIFRPLVDVKLDTVANLSDHDGNIFKYRIKETKIVKPNDTSVLDQYNQERKLLTLQTSYPLGTALKRFIAIAELDEELTYGEDSQ